MPNKYGIRKTMDVPFEEAIEKVTGQLREQGFGVLTEIDMKATLKKKLGVDIRRYVILGACNPNLAYKAFQNELEIGLLLPCNVIVYETDDRQATVSFIDPLMMMGITGNKALEEVAIEARKRLDTALEALI
ncbi:MAG: DUF302 domain-containing protein [Acidobacteriota bacterium]